MVPLDEEKSLAELLGMMRSMSNDFQNQAEKLVCVEGKIDKILAAFPESGFMAHRLFHEKQIIADRDSRDFSQSLKKNIAIQGALAVLIIVGIAIWEYLKVKVRG